MYAILPLLSGYDPERHERISLVLELFLYVTSEVRIRLSWKRKGAEQGKERRANAPSLPTDWSSCRRTVSGLNQRAAETTYCRGKTQSIYSWSGCNIGTIYRDASVLVHRASPVVNRDRPSMIAPRRLF